MSKVNEVKNEGDEEEEKEKEDVTSFIPEENGAVLRIIIKKHVEIQTDYSYIKIKKARDAREKAAKEKEGGQKEKEGGQKKKRAGMKCVEKEGEERVSKVNEEEKEDKEKVNEEEKEKEDQDKVNEVEKEKEGKEKVIKVEKKKQVIEKQRVYCTSDIGLKKRKLWAGEDGSDEFAFAKPMKRFRTQQSKFK